METSTLLEKGDSYLEPVDYTAKNYEIIRCNNGWIYDRTMFPNTVVMEVILFSVAIFRTHVELCPSFKTQTLCNRLKLRTKHSTISIVL